MKYSVFSIQSSVLCGRRSLEAFDQSREHPLDLHNVFVKLSLYGNGHDPKISREAQEIFHFACGTHRYMQETPEVGPTPTSASLGNVGRNRIRRATNLRSQPEALLSGKRTSGLIDEQRQRVALLPHRQFFEVLHDGSG